MTKKNLISVLGAIGDLSSDGIFLISRRRNSLEYVNDATVRLFDISHSAFRHQPAFFINHIIPGDLEYLQSEFDRLLAEGRIEDVEFMVRSHDGSVRNISSSCYVIEQGKYIVGVLKDITKNRAHENYIINYGAKKNTLLDMITHNLSGPLAISLNIIRSLEGMVKEHNLENMAAHILLIKENAQHCVDLVTEFLEEEHLVSEYVSTKKNRFELVEKIETVLERFRKAYPDFEFVVKRNFDVLYLSNDDVKFLQIFNNLLSNAVKWSPTQSAIEVILGEQDEYCSITVKDHGVGIPDHLKSHIFQRNSQAGRPGIRGERSIGMGLFIVKKLAALMHGTISFESVENKGTSFTLRIPKGNPDDDSLLHRNETEGKGSAFPF